MNVTFSNVCLFCWCFWFERHLTKANFCQFLDSAFYVHLLFFYRLHSTFYCWCCHWCDWRSWQFCPCCWSPWNMPWIHSNSLCLEDFHYYRITSWFISFWLINKELQRIMINLISIFALKIKFQKEVIHEIGTYLNFRANC